MARKVDELPVYQAATELWRAVNAILERGALRKDRKLRDQISDANDSMTSNIAEGFDQPSDAAFVAFLYHSKGSVAEVEKRVGMAHAKKYVTLEELNHCRALADTVGKQLGGFIKYLTDSDFRDRGRFKRKIALPPKRPEDQESKDQGSED